MREAEIARVVAEASGGQLSVETVSPLEAMLICMRWAMVENDRVGILAAAMAAAPYIHPRLSSSDVKITNVDASMTPAEIDAELEAIRAKKAAAKLLN